MNKLSFTKLNDEGQELIELLTTNIWEFHSEKSVLPDQINKALQKGWYSNDRETYWIEENGAKTGLLIIHDFSDTIPSFDIRIAKDYRGKGHGAAAVKWLTDYLFTHPDQKIRIEAYTRRDNLAMRKTLYNSGYVKEGHLRNAWENKDGTVSDSCCYAIIRSDWEEGKTTPVCIDDYPY
ncbi:GNAT family N-acetyltransferase [Jeotgalibacillus proteolyticus]|uniref:GNAT family N-acetyltransferase n=1 Tax=Jeotgalibacillus proteolyticus TaxID=2082395 RepID=A0A2S5GBR6_9BACL|nr:GNAT family protein [Jeotgalibacillus proteolyticus]PPA70355.1 GNAT family N-acetyltransferase [Jeotgalibacillus proteolyticus]